MIHVVERVQWGISGLVLLLGAGLFIWPGLPTTIPKVARATDTVTQEQFLEGLSEDEVIKYRNTKAEVHSQIVPPAMVDSLRNLGDVGLELGNARSQVKNGRLRVDKIEPNSFIDQLGFQNEDEIETINGLKLDWKNRSVLMKFYRESLDNLDGGGVIVVRLRRKGIPMELRFKVRR